MRLYVYILLFSLGFLQGQYRDIPEVVTKVATSAANWLKLETSARAIGMGPGRFGASVFFVVFRSEYRYSCPLTSSYLKPGSLQNSSGDLREHFLEIWSKSGT